MKNVKQLQLPFSVESDDIPLKRTKRKYAVDYGFLTKEELNDAFGLLVGASVAALFIWVFLVAAISANKNTEIDALNTNISQTTHYED